MSVETVVFIQHTCFPDAGRQTSVHRGRAPAIWSWAQGQRGGAEEEGGDSSSGAGAAQGERQSLGGPETRVPAGNCPKKKRGRLRTTMSQNVRIFIYFLIQAVLEMSQKQKEQLEADRQPPAGPNGELQFQPQTNKPEGKVLSRTRSALSKLFRSTKSSLSYRGQRSRRSPEQHASRTSTKPAHPRLTRRLLTNRKSHTFEWIVWNDVTHVSVHTNLPLGFSVLCCVFISVVYIRLNILKKHTSC